jgi:hypothetical protein
VGKRFEQRLGRFRGPIDGGSIAINPRNDETALHYGNEHQGKLARVEAFRNFAVGLAFAESSRKDILEFAEIAFSRKPSLGRDKPIDAIRANVPELSRGLSTTSRSAG